MPIASEFALLIQRVRAGDQSAAAAIVRQFEPLIHREIRLRLEDQRLREMYDTADVSQSVLASFFVRAAVGEYDVDDPDRLIALLIAMTRNKVATLVRRQRRQKRDHHRAEGDQVAHLAKVPAREPTPSAIAIGAELVERARELLGQEERAIAALRETNHSWQQVADRCGGTPQARRVQFMRAMRRVTQQLGIEGAIDAST